MKKPKLKTTLACCATLTAAFALAACERELTEGERISDDSSFTVPSCQSRRSIPVTFYLRDDDYANFTLAYAREELRFNTQNYNYNWQPVIVFSNRVLPLSDWEKHFIARHECAHHALGHTFQIFWNLDDQKQSELDADCAAARSLKQDFGDAFGPKELRESMQMMFAYDHSKDPDHPPPQERYKHALQCMQKGPQS